MTRDEWYLRCNNESTLDDAKKIIRDAIEALGKLAIEPDEAEDIIIQVTRSLEDLEDELSSQASEYAENTPCIDENNEHRTY